MEQKQTALNWYRLESQKLIIKAIRKEISNEEWRLLENKLGEQALQMEREQIIQAHGNKMRQDIENNIDVYFIKTGEQYYNKTYGGKDE